MFQIALLLLAASGAPGSFNGPPLPDPTGEIARAARDQSYYAHYVDPKKDFTISCWMVEGGLRDVATLTERLQRERTFRKELAHNPKLEKPDGYYEEADRLGVIGGTCIMLKKNLLILEEHFTLKNFATEVPADMQESNSSGEALIKQARETLQSFAWLDDYFNQRQHSQTPQTARGQAAGR